MNLSELKRREKELRKRLGDERYEQIYMRQQRSEQASAKPVLPAYKQPEAADTPDRMLNNTQRTNSSAVPARLAIADFRKGIEELDKRIESLNKQQYHVMLSGDDKKTADYDKIISNAEKQRDALKEEMARAMGAGSGSGRDMLRAGGNPADRPLFKAENVKQAIGLDDEEDITASDPTKKENEYISQEDYFKQLKKLRNELELNKKFKEDSYEGTARAFGKHNSQEAVFFNDNYKIAEGNIKKIENEINVLKGNREWSKTQEKGLTPHESNDYINEDDYINSNDYYKDMAERAWDYLDNGDVKGLVDFFKENDIDDNEKRIIGEYVKELKEKKLTQHLIAPAQPDSKPLLGDPKNYGNYWDRPPMDKDYGSVYVNGNEVNIIPWSPENSEYPHEVIGSYHFHQNNFNGGRFAKDFEFEEDAPAGFLFVQLAHQVLKANDWFDVDVDIVNIDGEKKAIIKYNDSGWANLYKEPGRVLIDVENGTDITLNEKHTANEFGYIYAEDGKTWLKPLIYPGEQYIKSGEDVTYQLKEPVEVPKDLVKKINDIFLEQGLGIELPY